MSAKNKENSGAKVIQALAKISEAITSDLYLEDILKLIVAVTAEVMGSNICSILLLDKSGRELSVKATQSVSEEYNKKANIKLGEGVAGKVAREGKPITVLDVRKDKRYKSREIAVHENLCSLLSVPLFSKKKVIGVLNCYTPKPHRFSHNEINVLKSIANQAAIVIENFRLIVESNVIREELESRKIVERAKGILMKKEALSEEEAYQRIRRYSMDKRRSMREIAEAIMLNEELGKAH
ncbi:MAG: GAF and ANTAR domain-containing protein [Candidatus Omnitrophica bacterium]|nr:GAF and ANTAR domain-containing protein [Candidatus Omnitrophota bacterium]MBU4488193.1 GAF and ANTAR domain-containing protein [Candidatus Omnitrophota bacterium]